MNIGKISCNASQCKRKKWCKRYQLYLQNVNNTGAHQGFFLNFKQAIQQHQSIDTYKCFIPTEQYLIKEELKELINKLNKLS